jgi:serine protease AprX
MHILSRTRGGQPATPSGTPWSGLQHIICLLLIVTLALSIPLSSPAHAETRVLPQLLAVAAESPNLAQRIIVQRMSADRGADAAVLNRGGSIIRDLGALDAFVAMVPGHTIHALGFHPAVRYVSLDAPMRQTATIESTKLAALYPATVKAPIAWLLGKTGKGIGVAVVDTGINENLRDFNHSTKDETRLLTRQAFTSYNISRLDRYGHGTVIAGIIGGNSCNRTEAALKCRYIGIAPESSLIDVTVAGDDGVSYISDVITGIEWVIKERTTYNIRVMNLSLVSSVAESYRTSILAAAVERAWFSGILVVVSAGNSGQNTMLYPPANDPFVITVGASDMMGTVLPTDDRLAPWSSYGITQDGHAKPDVVAPGRAMIAPLSYFDAGLVATRPDRVVDSQYMILSGTSMSAPVVAGVAALAFQAHPEWTNDQVKWLLMNTAAKLGDQQNPLPGQGAGLVNAAAIVTYRNPPSFANQGLVRSDLLVVANGETVYTSANWSTANWSTANWSTANWSTANWSTANWSTANWSTAIVDE